MARIKAWRTFAQLDFFFFLFFGVIMRVRINVFVTLRRELGWKNKIVQIDSEKAILFEVISVIPELANKVFDGDKIRSGFIVLVNGRNVRFLNEGRTRISDGDEISIFPPVGGG